MISNSRIKYINTIVVNFGIFNQIFSLRDEFIYKKPFLNYLNFSGDESIETFPKIRTEKT
jgi:hypothetical protein